MTANGFGITIDEIRRHQENDAKYRIINNKIRADDVDFIDELIEASGSFNSEYGEEFYNRVVRRVDRDTAK